MPTRRPLAAFVLALAAASPCAADTVVLTNGKTIDDVVVSRQDGDFVIVNPWGSRHPDMTWEIPDKNRIPRERVAEVVIADPPLIEYRRRAATLGLSADEHVALADFCSEHKFKEERVRHLRAALALEPGHAAALDAMGGADKWARASRGDGDVDPAVRDLEHEYIALEDTSALEAQLDRLKETGSKRPLVYLERARRSAAQEKGRRDRVPLTYRSADAPGATYCIYVPRDYDPLVATPLVVALHGGGAGGADPTLVTGSGEQAMNFYTDVAETWGTIVVCPSALAAPWRSTANEPWIDALLEEMQLLYNVDQNRIYLTGHSMGGFGTWHWGPARSDVWAAIAPCAGGGGPGGIDSKGLPAYIFHGSDDRIVGASSDRSAARSLASGKKPHDFVYTELDGVGHGFPDWVRKDIFRFLAARWKDRGRKRATGPASSFDRKPSKDEIRAFGDPSALPDDETETGTKSLLAALARGGGAGREAAAALGELRDPRVCKSVAKLLRPKKTTADTRTLAAEAIGRMGLAEGIKPLEGAFRDDDFRVVEAAVVGLARIAASGVPDAVAPLARGIERLGDRFEESIQGDAINFTEYEVRLASLGAALDAASAVRTQDDVLLRAVESAVIVGVFERSVGLKVLGETDPRFKDNPSRARLGLLRALAACLASWADAESARLLERVAKAWEARQPRLAAEALEGAAAVRAAEPTDPSAEGAADGDPPETGRTPDEEPGVR